MPAGAGIGFTRQFTGKTPDMTSFEIVGKLFKKYDTESKTQTFQAREFVLEVEDGNYPQYVKFQLTQDRCGLLDNYDEGQTIKVHFDLRGREWQGRFFTNLNAWRLEPVEGSAEVPPPPMPEADFPTKDDEPLAPDQDLPF